MKARNTGAPRDRSSQVNSMRTTPHPSEVAGRGLIFTGHERSREGTLRVLGGFELEFGSRESDRADWRRTHARRLLQVLGSASDGVERRSRIQTLLWPEFDEARSRNRLHHTLHLVRKSLDLIPKRLRPEISVNADHLQIQMQPGTLIDAQEFMRLVKSESPSSTRRLSDLGQALAWYRGPLAPDWEDIGDIAARRSWLEGLLSEGLEEAVDLALQEGRAEEAMAHAKRRALLHPDQIEPHLAYVHLLVEQGRPEVALQHCSSNRETIAEFDVTAAVRLDAVVRDIQKCTNRTAAIQVPPADSHVHQELKQSGCALPQAQPIFGYDSLIANTCAGLIDPFCRLVALVGPPGSGKSAVAAAAAQRLEPDFSAGAYWVDCSRMPGGNEGLASHVLSTLKIADGRKHQNLESAVSGRELLLVLDGLEVGASMGAEMSKLLALGSSIRWLITAWSPTQVAGERTVFVDPLLMLTSPAKGLPSFASQLLTAWASHPWDLSDKGFHLHAQALAQACGGLPWMLELAAHASSSLSPNELVARIGHDRTALFRWAADHGGLQHGAQSARLLAWMSKISEPERQLTILMTACGGWLRRQDVLGLSKGQLESPNNLLEGCVRHQCVSRRVRSEAGRTWSEYRVPEYVRMILEFSGMSPDASEVLDRMERWLLCAVPNEQEAEAEPEIIADWYESRIEDFETLIAHWQMTKQFDRIGRLCLAHAAGLARLPCAHRMLVWLTSLGESMHTIEDDLAAVLLVKRAALRERLGSPFDAFSDAVRALERVRGEGESNIKSHALTLIERLGRAPETADPSRDLQQRGAGAAEMLLRLAPLTAHQGDLPKALLLCGEAAGILSFFGLKRGLVKAHQQRAKIAYAMGNLDLSNSCLALAERAADAAGDAYEINRCQLMGCVVSYSRSRFAEAIDTASSMLSDQKLARQPALYTRAMLVLAWNHYAAGALPVAHAIAADLNSKLCDSPNFGARISVATLAALIEARRGWAPPAGCRAGTILAMTAKRWASLDAQESLINVAELAFLHDRLDLCQRTLHALARFSQQPDHRLRAYVEQRRDGLVKRMTPVAEAIHTNHHHPWHEVLNAVLLNLTPQEATSVKKTYLL